MMPLKPIHAKFSKVGQSILDNDSFKKEISDNFGLMSDSIAKLSESIMSILRELPNKS